MNRRMLLTLLLMLSILAGLPGCSSRASDSAIQPRATGTPAASATRPDIEQAGMPGALTEGKDVTLRDQYPVSQAHAESLRQFAAKTAAALLIQSDQNSCFSPLSLHDALSLAAIGARGTTQSELLALLGAADGDELARQGANLYRQLYMDNPMSQLKIANSLWLANRYQGQEITFKQDYIQRAADQFFASLYRVDFSKDSAGQAMAKWIADNTNGTLNPAFEPDREQIMSIINTVYFRDEWVNRFDDSKTKPDLFHLADGSTAACDFMNMQCQQNFTRGDGFTASSLNLKSYARMVFVLPDKGIHPADLLARPGGYQQLFDTSGGAYGKVTWKIPKFAFKSDFNLKKALQALGVSAAFKQTADFSGITDHLAFISSVIQKTHIAIDEKGVEASAFTQITYYGAAQPTDQAEMILDRPFLFAVLGRGGEPLFIGVCANPTER